MNAKRGSHHPDRRLLLRCRRRARGLVATLPIAHAQDYPIRTVRIIVPFPAGGTADAMPRAVSDYLSRKWKQPVVIENRAGAGGNVGAEAAYKSEPDGYTLLSAPPPPLVINHNLYPKMGFDPLKFLPIAVMGAVPNALLTHPNFPPNSVAEVIAYAKANPAKCISATQGNGTTSHLTSEMFAMLGGVKFTHVPYRGAAPALTDLVGGTANVMFDNLGTSLPQVQAGKIKLLGVATPKRMPTAAGCSDHRGNASGLRGDCLVCSGCSTRDAEADRGEGQRRHQRSLARSGGDEAHGNHVGANRWWHYSANGPILPQRSRSLAPGDQGGKRSDRVGVSVVDVRR